MSVDVQFNVDQALTKLGELVSKHGPQAVDLAAEVVRVNAIGTIVPGLIGALVSAASVYGACKLYALGTRKNKEHAAAYNAYLKDRTGTLSNPDDESIAPFGIAIGLGVVALFSTITSLVLLTDVWAWVALFNPKLALAREVIVKLAGLAQ